MSLERCFSRPLYTSPLKGESLQNKAVTRWTSSDLQLSHDLLFTLYCLMFYRLLIEYTEDKGNDAVAWKGYVYVVCFLVVQAFQVSLTQHSLHISFTSAMRVHSSIIGAVYNKVKATPLGTGMMKVNHSNTPPPPITWWELHLLLLNSCFFLQGSVLHDALNAGHPLLVLFM